MCKDDREMKAWTCSNHKNHVLGQVQRNGSGVRRLLIYRNAVDTSAEEPGDVDVIAVAEGTIFDVRCSICGGLRTWVLGQEGLERLFAQMQRARQVTAGVQR